MKIVLVFLGGGAGSVLRYLAGLAARATAGPWATLAVNALGSLFIGLFCGWSARFGWSEGTRLALTVGLCGGFTTFSTFSKEALSLAGSGRWGTFTAYALGSIALGLVAVALGIMLARANAVYPPSQPGT